MKTRSKSSLANAFRRAAVTASVIVTALSMTHGFASANVESFQKLPLAPGYTSGSAVSINNSGTIVGVNLKNSVYSRAVTWDNNGAVRLLPVFVDQLASGANAINNSGVAVGWVNRGINAGSHAVRWDSGTTIRELAAVQGAPSGQAIAISDTGFIVGTASTVNGSVWHGVRWNIDGSVSLLPALPGYPTAYPRAVNDDGVAVGYVISADFTQLRAVRWDSNGAVTLLDTAEAGNAIALSINKTRIAVGYAEDSFGDYQATRWNENGEASTLEALEGDTLSQANAIGNDGISVGHSGLNGEPPHAVYWDLEGIAVSLEEAPDSIGSSALGLNDHQKAVGHVIQAGGANLPVLWANQW